MAKKKTVQKESKPKTAKGVDKKVTTVHTHPRHVKPSLKNPNGITIVDQHLRRLPGTYLDEKEIYKIANGYSLKNVLMPAKNKIKMANSDLYDAQIALWTDYFNDLFKIEPRLDPDMIKALMASESSFHTNARTQQAIGITQITKETLKILQDPAGEVKDFIFHNISQKDLENPDISIPMAVRWLAYKKARAEAKLDRPATHEDIILEYKGILKSKTDYKNKALKIYRNYYDLLKK